MLTSKYLLALGRKAVTYQDKISRHELPYQPGPPFHATIKFFYKKKEEKS